MNKKVLIPIVLVCLVIIAFLVLNYNEKDNKNLDKDNSKVETSFLTSTVIGIDDKYITLQDESNVIYTFLVTDTLGLEVGNNIELEYKGVLNKELSVQENEIVGYKLIETKEGNVPLAWLDNGIFSKYYELAYNTLKDMTVDEVIGQILLARTSDVNQVNDLKKYHFGGYLLFKRDFEGKTKNEVINMIKEYQNNANIPLLIAADEEGGTVSRISSNKNLVSTPFKSPQDLYKSGGLNAIKEDTINKSKILSELGINLNLAPVVDVSTSSSDYMYKRSLGEDASKTSDFATTVINASKSGKVSYTLKHFPGYGNNLDTHSSSSVDSRSKESIMNNDILPFKAGIKAGAEAVLVSHNTVTSIDPSKPASLSKDIHNLLRSDLGFTGIIITDDLAMGAIGEKFSKTAVKDAILAGNDLLIVSDYKGAVSDIKEALKDGSITEEMLSKLAFRVIAWKYYKGLITPNQK